MVLIVLAFFVLFCLQSFSRCELSSPTFPLQFESEIEILAHLIPISSQYPPHSRKLQIYYDYLNQRARVNIESGYEAAKFYIRRYDQNAEYMVRLPPINDCKHSYMGDLMPFPLIPDSEFMGHVLIGNTHCAYYIFSEFNTRIHMYFTPDNHPFKLVQEQIEDEQSVLMLTYQFRNFKVGPPSSSYFELDNSVNSTCDRHNGGFPYIHIFHYFVKL